MSIVCCASNHNCFAIIDGFGLNENLSQLSPCNVIQQLNESTGPKPLSLLTHSAVAMTLERLELQVQ